MRGRTIPHITNQRGIVLVLSLLIMTILSVLGLAFLATARTEDAIAVNYRNHTAAFYAAEAGLGRVEGRGVVPVVDRNGVLGARRREKGESQHRQDSHDQKRQDQDDPSLVSYVWNGSASHDPFLLGGRRTTGTPRPCREGYGSNLCARGWLRESV